MTLHQFLIGLTVWCVLAGLAVIFMRMPAAADHDAPESRIPEPATPETLEFFANHQTADEVIARALVEAESGNWDDDAWWALDVTGDIVGALEAAGFEITERVEEWQPPRRFDESSFNVVTFDDRGLTSWNTPLSIDPPHPRHVAN
jgi:hypothetical protein